MSGRLRKLTTDDEIRAVLDKTNGNVVEAAAIMSDLIGKNVSYQLMAHWSRDVGVKKSSLPKILLFDIETSPLQVYSWGLFNQNIPIGAIIHDWEVLCWSAKWLGEKKILNQNQFRTDDEFDVVLELWQLLDEADAVVAHNAKRFDVKKMNAKFLQYGLGNPSYYKVIDTLQIAKGNLALTSNKLDWIAKFLEEDRKQKVDLQLWIDCVNGDEKAYKKMQRYCDQDVKVLEQVYLKLRYLDKNTPQMSAYSGSEDLTCNACGAKDLIYTADKHTTASTFQVFTCIECTHNNQIRWSTKPKNNMRVRSV